MRNITNKMHSLSAQNEVLQVGWHPFNETVLGSISNEVMSLWDIGRVGESKVKDIENGPPELLFIHKGHKDRINDFSFNFNDPWILSTVSDDNVLQVWKIAEDILESES